MRYLQILLLAAITMVGCQEASDGTITKITPEEMRDALRSDQMLQVLDVRTAKEFEVGHLSKSQNVCVTDANFTKQVAKFDKEAPVYVYCKKGGRSANAAKILKDLGFTKIYDLDGGVTAWDENGFSLEN